MSFHYTNTTAPPPPSPLPTTFTITAPPSTDIWRKPPNHDVFTAPILHQTIPLDQFHRIRVSVSAKWKTLYDQGGLLFARPRPPPAAAADAHGGEGAAANDLKWIKAGIEFVDGKACISVVAAEDRAADWSLMPLDDHHHAGTQVTIEFERDKLSLWVYLVVGADKGTERRTPIRKVTWAFAGAGEGETCWAGVYAAKPTVEAEAKKGEEGLEVGFSGLVVR